MTRLADDDDGVTRFGKLTCLALDLRDVGTGRVHDRKAAFRSLIDDLRSGPVTSEHERSPAGFVERVGNRDALDRKIVDHAWIMDEGTERVHGAGIVGSPACHLEGAIHPVAGTRVPCDFDGDSHDVP